MDRKRETGRKGERGRERGKEKRVRQGEKEIQRGWRRERGGRVGEK